MSAGARERVAAIRARREAALAEVSRMCHGGRWAMTIPVDEQRDTDCIITNSLSDIPTLLAALDAAERERDNWRDYAGACERESARHEWTIDAQAEALRRRAAEVARLRALLADWLEVYDWTMAGPRTSDEVPRRDVDAIARDTRAGLAGPTP